MNNYVVYHLHSDRSLLDSCTDYKLYIDKAKELGQTAICFSEHSNVYNWLEKKMYCDASGIKYIHGVECYLTKALLQSTDDNPQPHKVRDNYHTILIAKNYEGLKEINRLVDASTRPDHMYYKPRISFDEFKAISSNVIKISACLASPLNKLRDESLIQFYDYLEWPSRQRVVGPTTTRLSNIRVNGTSSITITTTLLASTRTVRYVATRSSSTPTVPSRR